MTPRVEEFTQPEPLATFWRQPTPGTYYWRCKIPAKHLPGQALLFKESDLAERDGEIVFPRQQGAAVWQYAGNATTGTLMAAMQEQGTRVLLEADDNYLRHHDIPLESGWVDKLDRSGSSDRFSYEAHGRLARFADGVIVSTGALADEYSGLNDNVYVCPNSIDPDDWPEPEKRDDGVLRIGWAASPSHVVDAPLVRRALKWAADQHRVEVWVYGIGDVYKFPGGVRKMPWTDDLAAYRRSLALCDIHICPLVETAWSRGKSDVKALEAAMAGAWPIVSTATPYRPWHDRTVACTTAKDWERAIRWAVVNRDEIPALAAKARDYVMSERLIEHSIHLWREAIHAPEPEAASLVAAQAA